MPMQKLKPLLITALVAGTLSLPTNICQAKPLFEWPGAKKPKIEKEAPKSASAPAKGEAATAATGQAARQKPAPDPYWPEIDMPDTPAPKFVQPPAGKPAAAARRAPVVIPDTVPDIIPDAPAPVRTSIPDLLAPLESEPAASPAPALIHQSINEQVAVPAAAEPAAIKPASAEPAAIAPAATAAATGAAAIKKAVVKPAAKPVVKPIAQSTTTSAFKASEAHRIAMREVSKAVHINRTPTSERIVIATDSLFDRDQSTITPTGELALSQLVERASQWSEHPVVIECHTDSFGFENYIRKLSQERADCLRSWFIQRNLLQDIQVKAVGVGKVKPLVPNQKPNGKDDLVAMAINRRVEIHVDKTKGVEVPVVVPDPENNNEEAPANQQQPETMAQNNNENSEFGDASIILNQLPRLEDVKVHGGRTMDATSEAEKPPEQLTPEKIREHEWEQKEFGLWRD